MIGGRNRPRPCRAESSTQVTIIGAAIQTSACTDVTSPVPKRRKTPATMPITMDNGMADIRRPTQPVRPRANMKIPVAMNAPTISGQDRCDNAGPTSTVPGMVQKKAIGRR